MGTALPALHASRRASVLDAVASLAGRLSASSPALALVLKFRLGLLANPQNFYPVEGTDLLFLNEEAAASWLEASPSQGCIANELYELKILHLFSVTLSVLQTA